MEKHTKQWVLLALFLLVFGSTKSNGQSTMDAVSFGGGSDGTFNQPLNGYIVGFGVGWSFVPTTDLLVTGISARSPQLSLWQSTNQPFATFTISGSAYVFEPIVPLLLTGGQSYFISCQNPGFTGTVLFSVYSQSGVDNISRFTSSPYISQVANYRVSADGQRSLATPDNSEFLLYGPNFQFQVVPEPSNFTLWLLAALALCWVRFLPWIKKIASRN